MGNEQRRLYSITKAIQYLANKYSITRTPVTLRKWAAKHKFGHKIGGPDGDWVIDIDKLDAFITDGEPEDG